MKMRTLLSLGLWTVAFGAQAAPTCTPHTTRGAWVYTCEGSLPSPQPTPTRMLGRCNSSKSAYWTCEGTVNLGGQILPQLLSGQADNQPDCTGTISYVHTLGGAPAGLLDIRYVIHDRGNAIQGLPVNSGGVLACTLRRIDTTD